MYARFENKAQNERAEELEFEKGQLGLATRSAISTSGAESEKSSNGESKGLLCFFRTICS